MDVPTDPEPPKPEPPTPGPPQPGPPTVRRPRYLAARLSVQMFLAFAVQGSWVPVFSVYLDQLGFSPAAVAWAFAAYSLSSLFAPLVWGQIADRWVPAERCISLCAVVDTLILALIPSLGDPVSMFLACTVFWFFLIPINSLGTALTMRQLEHPERTFGFVRLWGTVGWASAGLLLSLWLRTVKPIVGHWLASRFGWLSDSGPDLTDSFWLAALFAAAVTLYSLTLPRTSPSPAGAWSEAPAAGLRRLYRLFDAPMQSLRLFQQRSFLTFCVCLFGFYVTMPFNVQLTPLLLRGLGVDRDALPMALTVSQSSEIAILALLPCLLVRFGSKSTMTFGIAAWTLGLSAFAVGTPTALVITAMTAQGIFIGCFLVAGQVFVNRQSAADVRASVQGLIVLISGAGLLAGHLLVGAVRELTQDNFHLAYLPAAVTSAMLVAVFITGYGTRQAAEPSRVSLVSARRMP